jgi:hypothetical protein
MPTKISEPHSNSYMINNGDNRITDITDVAEFYSVQGRLNRLLRLYKTGQLMQTEVSEFCFHIGLDFAIFSCKELLVV